MRGPPVLRGASPRQMKLVASALLLLPLAVLLLFAIGEMSSGELNGAQHLVEVGLLLLLVAAAWRYPLPVGIVLLALTALLFAFMLYRSVTGWGDPEGFEVVLWPVLASLLVVPPLVAGWLLVAAGRSE